MSNQLHFKLLNQKKILIVEQFRPPVETVTFDLPGGLIQI